MSVLTKVPYILTIMLTLSKAEKESFAEALDTPVENFVEVGFLEKDKKISELQNTVTCVALRTSYKLPRKLGYLIKKSNKVHFLCFSENPGRNQLVIYEVVGVSLVKINEFLDAEELRNILTDEGQSEIEITPASLLAIMEGDTEEAGVNVDLSEDGSKVKVTLDQDIKDVISGGCTVTINGSTISLQQFIDNCEAGTYTTVGTIATMHSLIDGKDFRIILIGTDHDVLSATDAGELEPDGETAKTTWHFYDMPMRGVKLGLPYVPDVMDGAEGAPEFDPNYPSNWFGYPTATSLLDALQTVFSSLPKLLQNHIKTVRKDHYVPVLYFDDYESYNSTKTMIQYETDRYGWSNQKLFCLSATEVGIIPDNDGTQHFPYSCEDADENEIMLEGKKYAYFNETKAYESEPETDSRRPRYFGEEAYWYWLRSPCLDFSYYWGSVYGDGYVNSGYTNLDNGLAPAFCI